MRGRGVALLLVTAALVLGFAAAASAKTHWLCKPGTNASFCTPPLTTTTLSPTGDVLGTSTPKRDKDPEYDCFYVYPTVSDQKTQTANFAHRPRGEVDRPLPGGALHAALPPVRPRLPPAHAAGHRPGRRQREQHPAAAVRLHRRARRLARLPEALQRRPAGRAASATRRARSSCAGWWPSEIDPKPKVRKLLISAVLLGGNVLVPQGQDVGGDFKHIPACRVAAASSAASSPTRPSTAPCRRTRSSAARPLPATRSCAPTPRPWPAARRRSGPIAPTAPFAPGTTLGLAIPLIGIPPLNGYPTTWVSAPNSTTASAWTPTGPTSCRSARWAARRCSTPCRRARGACI